MELRGSGIQSALPAGTDLRVLYAGVAAGSGLHAPVFVLLDRIVVSQENRARIVDAAEIAYREAGEVIFEMVPRESRCGGNPAPLLRRIRVHELPQAGEGAGAAAVQLQQSVWGLPALPGIREHRGLRSESGDPGQGAEPE